MPAWLLAIPFAEALWTTLLLIFRPVVNILMSFVVGIIARMGRLTGVWALASGAFLYRIVIALIGLTVYKVTGVDDFLQSRIDLIFDYFLSGSFTSTAEWLLKSSGVWDGLKIWWLTVKAVIAWKMSGGILTRSSFNPYTV